MSYKHDTYSDEVLELKGYLDSNNVTEINKFIDNHDISFFFTARFEDKHLSSKNYNLTFSFPQNCLLFP